MIPIPHTPAYVISIRSDRRQRFIERVQTWKRSMVLVEGTIGHNIDRSAWIHNGKIPVAEQDKLTRGRLGCYDSHMRAWLTESNIPFEIDQIHKPCEKSNDSIPKI